MFNFHEKVKKQTGRATGDGVFGLFCFAKKAENPVPNWHSLSPVRIPIITFTLLSQFPLI